jgi:hypothetical protein
MLNRIRSLVLAGLLVSAAAGCARSPQAHFYTLAPMAQTSAATTPPAFSVAVYPVTLPEFVDRPQLVVNSENSRVQVLEMDRWAEPLKNAIPRLLAENLSRLLGTDQVSSYPQNAASEAGLRLVVDFLHFESVHDAVLVEALWSVRSPGEGPGAPHRFKIKEVIRGDGNDERVAAYSRALAALSSDIAVSLREYRKVLR